MVLAPEHPLVDAIATPAWPADVDARWTGGAPDPATAIAEYRAAAARKSDLDRQENKDKTGVFTGAYAVNPVNGTRDPGVRRRLRADGLRHRRDHGRARAGPARLGLRDGVRPADHPHGASRSAGFEGEAYIGEGPAINSANAEISLNGLGIAEAKRAIIDWLVGEGLRRGAGSSTSCATGCSPGSATGASRSRSSGTPTGRSRCRSDQLPVELPEIDDYSPRTYDPDDANTEPEPPLSRATEWAGTGRATG